MYLCAKIGISCQEIRSFAKHFGLGFPKWDSVADRVLEETEDFAVGAVDEGGVEGGEVDAGGGFLFVAEPFAYEA